jgi:hypothetical protein
MANSKYKFGFVIAIVLSIAMSASGQGRGPSAPMRGPFVSTRGIPPSGRGLGRQGSLGTAPNTFRPGLFTQPLVGTPLNPNFRPTRGAPGLGFDFEHLAAIERPFRDRFGRVHQRLFFTPIFFDALPLYYPYDTEYPYESGIPDYYTEAAQQPQFVIPRPQPATPPTETTPRATEPQAPAPPPRELGQLILVRRDGQILLAVAFTTNRGQLTYVTQEGTRRSFPFSELDKDATRQMNDASGTSVSLPE